MSVNIAVFVVLQGMMTVWMPRVRTLGSVWTEMERMCVYAHKVIQETTVKQVCSSLK